MHISIKNNNLTNKLVQRLIIAVDFVVLWTLLFFVVGTIPQSEGWDEEKGGAFWMICTFALIVAEYLFPSVIHERVVGANDILRRSTMRKTNIDELPQFWNVLRGDMSIVGPRPHMLAHTEQYDQLIDKYMVRHFVKPGITGWAQVTGFRGETRELWQMEGRVERDIWYIQHWSLWLDLRILWMTVKLMFMRDGKAY